MLFCTTVRNSISDCRQTLKIEFVYSHFYFKIELTLKSLLISFSGPTLSPGTARACSLGRRTVLIEVAVPPNIPINSLFVINVVNKRLQSQSAQMEKLLVLIFPFCGLLLLAV